MKKTAWYHVDYRISNSSVLTTDCKTEEGRSTAEDFAKMIAIRATGRVADAARVTILRRTWFLQ